VGKELGTGRFSRVHKCVRGGTGPGAGKELAVKIIDKSMATPAEKDLMRSEISILKARDSPRFLAHTKH
jgi:hypothetical protein